MLLSWQAEARKRCGMRSYEGSEGANGGRTRTATRRQCAVVSQKQSGTACERTDFDGCLGLVVCVTDSVCVCVWGCGNLCDEGGASGSLLVQGDQIVAHRGVGHVWRG